jgi:hypothetical protein
LTDGTEAITDTYTFDAWGNEVASTGTTGNPFKYVGQHGYYEDEQSGLLLLGIGIIII